MSAVSSRGKTNRSSNMEKRFDILQTIRRMAPKHAATAAVFRNSQQLAYGVLTNVSVTGACIVTDNRVTPGSEVDLKLSFYQQPRPLRGGDHGHPAPGARLTEAHGPP